ncbi:MAG: ATP-binding protein [Comamonadaceae bacterium]|nr:ATP-binding protein [Comamonadaceae bacterium]
MLRQITETIPEAFWIVSADWREVTYISPAYEAIWGTAGRRALPQWTGLGRRRGRRSSSRQCWPPRPSPDMISRHEVAHFPDYQIRRPDGSLRWIAARAYPIVDASGRVLHFAGIAEDITERKRAETELLAAKKSAEAASADKSRFLAAVSHDLRQPMQAITLFVSALDRTPLSEEQRRIGHGLKRAASALSGLLDSLLDVSRLDAGVIEPHPRWIDLYEIFRQIDSEFAAAALERNLRFKLFFPDRALSVYADPELLMGMLRNLIANALAYTERGGVLVAARARRDRLLMQVWDTGMGIDPGNVPLIYDEFFQVGNRHRDRTRGLGLGLSIVKRLAALMGYELDCRSRPDRGSVFELGIPLDRTRAAGGTPTRVAEAEDDLGCLKGLRIVLIEDDMPVADSLGLWLESFGMKVLSTTRADGALADEAPPAPTSTSPISRLPGSMNGVEFLEAVERRLVHTG